MSLNNLQKAFKDAATSQKTKSFLSRYLPYETEESQERFAIYQNNIMANLAGVLASTFPVCEKLVGEDFFRHKAYKFIKNNLPKKAALFYYGEDFVNYFDAIGRENKYAYWGEVAAYEWAQQCCYYGIDAETLSRQDLASFDETSFGKLIVRLAPAVQLVKTSYNIQNIIDVVTEKSCVNEDDFQITKTHDHYLFYPTEIKVEVNKVDKLFFKVLQTLQDTPCSFETLAAMFAGQEDEAVFASFITVLFDRKILIRM